MRPNQLAKDGPHASIERHVGVQPAEHDGGERRGRGAVRGLAQAPPHPERIDHADPCVPVQQALDQTLGGVGLAKHGDLPHQWIG